MYRLFRFTWSRIYICDQITKPETFNLKIEEFYLEWLILSHLQHLMSFIKTYLSLKRNSILWWNLLHVMDCQKYWCPTMGLVLQCQEFNRFCSGCGIKRKFVYSSLSPLNKRTGWKACTNNKECLKDCFSAQQQCTVHWALITVLFVYHRTPHSTTVGNTPANLFIGRDLRSRFITARRSATTK